MVTGIQSLYDQRARLIEQMVALPKTAAAEGRAMSTEESDKFARIETDEAQLTRTIEAHEAAERLEARTAGKLFDSMDKAAPKADKDKAADYRAAYLNFLRKGNNNITPEERSLLVEKRGTANQIAGTDSLGGYLVPDLWQPEIERAMLDYSGILQACRVLRTATGSTLFWPTEDDTTTKAVKIGEASGFTVQDVTFGQKQLDAYKYGTIAKVSWELLQDNTYNIEQELRTVFAPRFGRILNQECTVGDGSGDPNGVVTASTLGKTAASATAFHVTDIIQTRVFE